jgi:hypothetical protein
VTSESPYGVACLKNAYFSKFGSAILSGAKKVIRSRARNMTT